MFRLMPSPRQNLYDLIAPRNSGYTLHLSMKRLVFWTACIAVLGSAIPVSGQSLESLLSSLPRDARIALLESGSIEQYLEDRDDVSLIPDHPLTRHIRRALRDAKPNVISEQLVLVEAAIDERGTVDLFNSLRRVSELSYIQYYNAGTDRTHDLFHESQAIDNPDDRRIIPDPVLAELPRDDLVWVLQGVPPFGDIVSEYRYRSENGAFLFFGTNHEAMPYRGFRVVRPRNMVTAILVVPTDEHVLMYGLGGVRAFTVFGLLDDRIESAFSGRTDGIFAWYYDTYLSELE